MHEDGSVNASLEVDCLSAKYPADLDKYLPLSFWTKATTFSPKLRKFVG